MSAAAASFFLSFLSHSEPDRRTAPSQVSRTCDQAVRRNEGTREGDAHTRQPGVAPFLAGPAMPQNIYKQNRAGKMK